MSTLDPRHLRLRVESCISREQARLVGIAVASRAELAEAMPAEEAVLWARFCAHALPTALREALAEGEALLVVEPAGPSVVDQAEPGAVDLGDLGDLAEPLLSEDDLEPEPELHHIEVLVVDVTGKPLSGIAYALTFPDGTVTTGHTDPDGMVRHEGLVTIADCRLTFPEHTKGAAA